MVSKSFSRAATALLTTSALILSTSLTHAQAAARRSSSGSNRNTLCYFVMWVVTAGTSLDSAGKLCN